MLETKLILALLMQVILIRDFDIQQFTFPLQKYTFRSNGEPLEIDINITQKPKNLELHIFPRQV